MSKPTHKPPSTASLPIVPTEPPSAEHMAHEPPAVNPNRIGKFAVLVATTLMIVVGVVLVSTYFIEREIEARISISLAKNLKLLPPGVTIEYTAVRVSLLRQSVALLNLKVTTPSGKAVEMSRVRVWGLDWDTLAEIAKTRKPVLPREIKFAVDGLLITSELIGAEGSAILQSLGYENLETNIYSQVGYDPASQTIDINELQVDVEKLGTFSGELHVGNFTVPSSEAIARLKKDPRLLLTETEEFTKITLKGFSVTYRDNSFIKRATQALQGTGEASPEELVQLAIEVNEPAPRDPASPPRPVTANDFTKPALNTLLNFVREPTSITLSSDPPRPIPLMSLLDEQSAGSINDLAHKLYLSCK